jgi:PPP family 3-phenylpropionic acid transporter
LNSIPHKRLSAFYFWYYGLLGILHPFWPIFLSHKHFTPGEIGLLLAIQMGTRIVSPNLWGALADATGQRLGTIRLGAAFACLCFAGIFAGDSFALMALVMAGYSFFWNAVMPQFEALTLDYLHREPERYSRIRLWGSVGFIIAVMVGGVWFEARIEDFRIAGLVVLAMIWLSSLMVPAPDFRRPTPRSGTFGRILRQKPVLAFLAISCLLQVAHGIYYAFFSLQMEAAGYGRVAIGTYWALGVVAEIVLFLVMHRLMTNRSLWWIMMLSLSLTVVRWLLISYFTADPVILFAAQALHAFSFGACHAVSMEYIRRFFPPENRIQGQAIYTAFSFGLGGAVGSLLGGAIWTLNPDLTFNVAALITAIAVYIAYRGLNHRTVGSGAGVMD